MPALQVLIDGMEVATLSTEGHAVVSATISGARVDAHAASLSVSAVNEAESERPVYRNWLNEAPLKPGQLVTVALLEAGTDSHAGKTIAELFPDEEATDEDDFTLTEERLAELRAQPVLHDPYAFRINASTGAAFAGRSSPDTHGFTFYLVWNRFHPEGARVALHTYTLDDLATPSTALNYLFEDRIGVSGQVTFEFGAG